MTRKAIICNNMLTLSALSANRAASNSTQPSDMDSQADDKNHLKTKQKASGNDTKNRHKFPYFMKAHTIFLITTTTRNERLTHLSYLLWLPARTALAPHITRTSLLQLLWLRTIWVRSAVCLSVYDRYETLDWLINLLLSLCVYKLANDRTARLHLSLINCC